MGFEPLMDTYSNQPLRFTSAQILCGLKQIWSQAISRDSSFSMETRIDEHLKAQGMWEELDFADVIEEIEEFFGFRAPVADWKEFFQFDNSFIDVTKFENEILPRLTFGALVQFIAERAPAISMEPATIFGRPCRPAGAFLGIQKIASHVKPAVEPFGPSTRIVDRLRGGSLNSFWERLRWIAEHRIPGLPRSWSGTRGVAASVGIILFVAGLVASWALSSPIYAASGLFLALVLWLAGVIYMYFVNPLPKGVETFGDLARVVANEGHE